MRVAGRHKWGTDKAVFYFPDKWRATELAGYESGSIQVCASDGVSSITTPDYSMAKEIYMGRAGTVNVYFQLSSSLDGNMVYAKIYLNGVAIGTERSTTSINYQTYTEDVTCEPEDLIQIYAKADPVPPPGWAARVRYFRIRVSNPVTPVVTYSA